MGMSHKEEIDKILATNPELTRSTFQSTKELLTTTKLLAAALKNAEKAINVLRNGDPVAADIYLKLAVNYIRESDVLP